MCTVGASWCLSTCFACVALCAFRYGSVKRRPSAAFKKQTLTHFLAIAHQLGPQEEGWALWVQSDPELAGLQCEDPTLATNQGNINMSCSSASLNSGQKAPRPPGFEWASGTAEGSTILAPHRWSQLLL